MVSLHYCTGVPKGRRTASNAVVPQPIFIANLLPVLAIISQFPPSNITPVVRHSEVTFLAAPFTRLIVFSMSKLHRISDYSREHCATRTHILSIILPLIGVQRQGTRLGRSELWEVRIQCIGVQTIFVKQEFGQVRQLDRPGISYFTSRRTRHDVRRLQSPMSCGRLLLVRTTRRFDGGARQRGEASPS